MDNKAKSVNKQNEGTEGGETEKKKKAAVITFNFPPIDYEALKKVPTFTLEIRHAAAKASDSALIDIIIPINSTLVQVVEIINEKHNNSLKNIKLYLGKEDAQNKT